MESAKYFILVGSLLLIMAISPGILKKLPFSSSLIYLLFGIFLGQHGINIIGLHEIAHSKLVEVISEITVIISLFTVGLKLRLPLRDKRWITPVYFATLSMVLTVGMVALVGHYFLNLGIGEAILLGAVISPTDPVLASDVQLEDPEDSNKLKFALTSEGGMNDGTAFPFVMLGLGLMGAQGKDWTWGIWFTRDLIWAISAGLLIGALSGVLVTRLATYVRVNRRSFYLEDFLTIASIALSYGLAIQVHSYGFLAVFANALTIRQIELKRPSETYKNLSEDVLSFNEQLERIFEVISVSIVGLLIDLRSFTWDCLFLALSIFVFIRPLATFAVTVFSKFTLFEKGFLSWFGVRGIGSIYYLYFAINHSGFFGNRDDLIKYTLWIIIFSMVFHGSSVKIFLKNLNRQGPSFS